MHYYIYDREGKRQGPLQNITSVQWNPKYNETGKAEIHVEYTEFNTKYLQKWNRIVCKERSEILFIESVERLAKEIVVLGHMDNLDDRINIYTLTVRNVEQSLLDNFEKNKRGLDITLGKPKGLPGKLETASDTTYDSLRTMAQEYCQLVGYGYREVLKGTTLNYFEIYAGSTKNKLRFSDRLGNLISQTFIEDISDYKNYAYVYGEESGSERKNVVVDLRTGDEPRMELYVDARDLQSTYKDASGNEQTYTQEEYNNLLKERGLSKLAETRKGSSKFEFEIDAEDKKAALQQDFDLGDVIPCLSFKFNIFAFARITGLKFVEENNLQTQVTLELELVDVQESAGKMKGGDS